MSTSVPEAPASSGRHQQPEPSQPRARKRSRLLRVASGFFASFLVLSLATLVAIPYVNTCRGLDLGTAADKDAIAHGWTISCVSTITGKVPAGPAGTTVQGIAFSDSKTIQVKRSVLSVDHTTAHEVGHALTDIYWNVKAQNWYDAQLGLKTWNDQSTADNYYQRGTESFAESYAYCSTVGSTDGARSDFTLAPCDVLYKALSMMKAGR